MFKMRDPIKFKSSLLFQASVLALPKPAWPNNVSDPGDWIYVSRNKLNPTECEIYSKTFNQQGALLNGSFGYGSLDVEEHIITADSWRVGKLPDPPAASVRNDGEYCNRCGRKNADLVLLNSITKYCPPCEGNGDAAKSQKSLDDEWNDMLSSTAYTKTKP